MNAAATSHPFGSTLLTCARCMCITCLIHASDVQIELSFCLIKTSTQSRFTSINVVTTLSRMLYVY